MTLPITVSHRAGVLWLSLFFVLLIGLPVLAELMPSQTMAMVDSFYRVGSLVFGGGHVVLPLLQAEVVPSGWVNNESFLAGYGAAQAVPGPLFTFAAFLGASMNTARRAGSAALCVCWLSSRPRSCWSSDQCHFGRLRRNTGIQAALAGINAAVVGLLLAALYRLYGLAPSFSRKTSAAWLPLSHLCSGSSRRGWLSSVAVQLGGC
ncbi:chromate transporter [Escherichia coli]|nr:chromate transporter [Escherichia coli]